MSRAASSSGVPRTVARSPVSVTKSRPGQAKTVGRGGDDDDSSPNDAAYKLALDKLEPLRAADGPSSGKLAAKDLLFVLHPEAMAIAAVSFKGKP